MSIPPLVKQAGFILLVVFLYGKARESVPSLPPLA